MITNSLKSDQKYQRFIDTLKLSPPEVYLKRGDEIIPWNIGLLITIQGIIQNEIVTKVIKILIKKHYYLNVSIISNIRNEYSFKYQDNANVEIKEFQIESNEEVKNIFNIETKKAFDVKKASLMRVIIFKENDTKYHLGLIISHIISDGNALIHLMVDLLKYHEKLYIDQEEINITPLEPKNFDLSYYSKNTSTKLNNQTPDIKNGTSLEKINNATERCHWHHYSLPEELTTQILKKCKEKAVSVYSFFTSALLLTSYKKQCQANLVQGLPIQYITITDIRKWLTPIVANEQLGQWVVNLIHQEKVNDKIKIWELAKQIRKTHIKTMKSNGWKKFALNLATDVLNTKSQSYSSLYRMTQPSCILDNLGNLDVVFKKTELKNYVIEEFEVHLSDPFLQPEGLLTKHYYFIILYLFNNKFHIQIPFSPWVETKEEFNSTIKYFNKALIKGIKNK